MAPWSCPVAVEQPELVTLRQRSAPGAPPAAARGGPAVSPARPPPPAHPQRAWRAGPGRASPAQRAQHIPGTAQHIPSTESPAQHSASSPHGASPARRIPVRTHRIRAAVVALPVRARTHASSSSLIAAPLCYVPAPLPETALPSGMQPCGDGPASQLAPGRGHLGPSRGVGVPSHTPEQR